MKKIIILCLLLTITGCKKNNINYSTTEDEIAHASNRPTLLNATDVAYHQEYSPNLPTYEINDLEDAINYCDIEYFDPEMKSHLQNDYFAIGEGGRFHLIYEINNLGYIRIPSFVTTDSFLHTFHLMYETIQRLTEEDYLINRVLGLSESLLSESKKQLETLRGTEWETAAQRNVDYFSIAVYLSGGSDYVINNNVLQEIDLINETLGIDRSPIFSTDEHAYYQDYTQFIVRGYYTDSDNLKNYFRTMMWYGQLTFTQNDIDLNKSALLLNKAINDSSLDDFTCVYEVTSLLAGESDDNTYFEYYPIIELFFGDNFDISELPNKNDEFNDYIEYISELPKPKINSMVTASYNNDNSTNTVGFRVFGQRFSLDQSILTALVYDSVSPNDKGEIRNMPTALDIPAALGSDLALNIIDKTTNATSFNDYNTNINNLRQEVSKAGDRPYTMSVSSAWLGSLTELLDVPGEGYPSFMQSEAWNKKQLYTFLGSYTELAHDLLLYQKHSFGAFGATEESIEKDDRGYVEPEPNLFHRVSSIVKAMNDGLQEYGLISDLNINYLNRLQECGDILESISIKELAGELPTDAEFDYIRRYDILLTDIYHYWIKVKAKVEYVTPVEEGIYPDYVISDIYTDPNTDICLENGVGEAMEIWVAVRFDNQIRYCRGATYSYYEFEVPTEHRLNDEQWREVIGSYNRDVIPSYPSWFDDLIVKGKYYRGTSYKGYEEMIGALNDHKIKCLANVKVRTNPSTILGEHIGMIEDGQIVDYDFYIENEGYTWYKLTYSMEENSWLECWVADDGTWFKKMSSKDVNKPYFGYIIEILADEVVVKDYLKDHSDVILHKGERYYIDRFYPMDNSVHYIIQDGHMDIVDTNNSVMVVEEFKRF